VSFDPTASPIDYVVLAGQRSPGIAEVLGTSSPRRWDERRGFGFTGAALIFRGVGLARPVIKIKLYTAQDWADWHAWRALVQRPPLGERARALDVEHPILDDLGISSIVVEDVLQPLQTADGEWTIEIRCIEYRRPLPAIQRIEGSATDEALSPNQALIESLAGQVQELAA
jgi:hypothetical protein